MQGAPLANPSSDGMRGSQSGLAGQRTLLRPALALHTPSLNSLGQSVSQEEIKLLGSHCVCWTVSTNHQCCQCQTLHSNEFACEGITYCLNC